MGVSLVNQTAEFALALLLGAGLGFVYDFMRITRGRVPLRGITAGLDVLFWAVCAAASFWFAMSVGGGELRVFAMVAISLGIVLYFTLLSSFVRTIGFVISDGLAELFKVIFRPIFGVAKKIHKFLIKGFSFLSKCRIIKLIPLRRKKVGDEGEEKEGFNQTFDQAVHRRNLPRLRRGGNPKPQRANRRTENRSGSPSSRSGGPTGSQRDSGGGYSL
jgi:spore cortex biosynthesis protein YabQ